MALLGGPSTVKYTPKSAYITSTADDALLSYSVNGDGTLTSLQAVPTPDEDFSLSLWPWGTEMVAASATPNPNLFAYPVSAATGLIGSTFSFGDAAVGGGVAVDPSGQFAFETDSTNGVIYTYAHTGNFWGLVQYVPPETFQAGAGAGPIVIDPSGLLVYIANQADNTISAYQYWGMSPELFESKGNFILPYTDGSPFALGASPVALAIDPNESFLYVLCADQTLRVFAIDYASGGHISQVASTSLSGQPVKLAVEPTGHFVYTTDSSGVSAFSVDALTGALSPVPLNPPITTANITGIYAEPAGQYLYVTTGATNSPGAVFGYTIGQDGNLSAISPNALATPLLPSSMAFTDEIR